ncbi:MAG: hypothetical protein A2Z50_05225 [Nitrospirae bacterium RBG_19FT_COMBO_42_15]|nr:MAG: hypothetical protein A2Z50_05225 [Nitrospirae bacterium RBG_19FT_COMBO_42_15]
MFAGRKAEEKPEKHKCTVYHSEIWGIREDKYNWLNKHDITKTKWKKIKPKSEFYLFIPRDEGLLKQYEAYPKITDIFPVNSVGIVTSRDSFAINTDREALKRRIRQFRDKNLPDDIIRQTFLLKDTSQFKLGQAREKVMNEHDWEEAITKILYRPFDVQSFFYQDAVIERPRRKVMHHMLQENIGLLTCRQQNTTGFYHAFVTNTIVESCIVSNQTREISYLFPLYLYQEKEKPKKRSAGSIMMLFEPQEGYQARKPNLPPALIEALTKAFKKSLSPEQIFYYIYAVLYSNTYRTKYAEFLKIDFPRIPFTKDYKLFNRISEYGKRLVELHLLKSPDLDPAILRLQGKGDNKVEKLKYDRKEKRLYLNQNQYFEGITEDVWQYQIGGYQVCDKWLKDRKGKRLSLEDVRHYSRIVISLLKTIKIQKSIDDVYAGVEKDIIEIELQK